MKRHRKHKSWQNAFARALLRGIDTQSSYSLTAPVPPRRRIRRAILWLADELNHPLSRLGLRRCVSGDLCQWTDYARYHIEHGKKAS